MSEVSAPAAAAPESAPVESITNSESSQGESVQSEVAGIQEAVENGDISVSEAKSMLRKFKLKVDGKELDTEIDLSDEDAVRNELQLAAVSKRRMQETAEIKKAYQKEMEELRNDPMAYLLKNGIDAEEHSVKYIQKKVEESKKSPEVIAAEKMQAELAEAREKLKKIEEEKEQENMTKIQAEASKALNEEIDKAISGHKKLSNSPMVRKKVADNMLWAIGQGYDDVTAEDVLPMVEKELRDEFGSFFDGLDDESFEEMVGRERINKARKRKVAAKVPSLSDVKPTVGAIKTPEVQAPKQKISAKEAFRRMGKG